MKIHLVRPLYENEDEEILEVLPAPQHPARTEAITTVGGLFDVLLKAPYRLDAFIHEPNLQPRLIVGFSIIVVAGFIIYGAVLAILFLAVGTESVPQLLRARWSADWLPAVVLVAAYVGGVWGNTFLLWPTYYYFAQLGGTRMSWAEVLTHSLKGKAATTILLLGLAPIYVVVMVGLILLRVPTQFLEVMLLAGVVLPFLVGLRGVAAIYSSFVHAINTLPVKERRTRYMVPGWLVFAWAMLFTITTPLLMWNIWIYGTGGPG